MVLSSSINTVLKGGRLVVITLDIVDMVELIVLVMDALVDLSSSRRGCGQSKRRREERDEVGGRIRKRRKLEADHKPR
jgi:hypothetical protein